MDETDLDSGASIVGVENSTEREVSDVQVERFPQWYQQRRNFITKGQKTTLETQWPKYGKSEQSKTLKFGEKVDFDLWFSLKREGGCRPRRWLDIGFGTGESLVQLAKLFSDDEFIGCEIYRPGHALVVQECVSGGMENIRLIGGDARKFLVRQCPPRSLDRVNVFFPDPFSKEKSTMRLVNNAFWEMISPKFRDTSNGSDQGPVLHIASDVSFYVKEIIQSFIDCGQNLDWKLLSVYRSAGPLVGKESEEISFSAAIISMIQGDPIGLEASAQAVTDMLKDGGIFFNRIPQRPLTHFERIAQNEGRYVWDLVFVRQTDTSI